MDERFCKKYAFYLLLASLALSGCSKSSEEPASAVVSVPVEQKNAAVQPSSQAPEPRMAAEEALQPQPSEPPPSRLPDYMLALPFESVAMHPGALALSADGSVAAHIALDGTIVVWNARTLELLETIPPEGNAQGLPGTLALNADGSLLAIGRFDSVVVLYSRREAKRLRELHGHSGAVSALAFSPDGRLLASGGDDATTYMWEVSTGRRLHAFDSQMEGAYRGGIVVSLAFTGDARALLVNEWYSRHYDVARGTSVWDLDEGIEIGWRSVAPPNGDNVMRSGQALGANNWLLTYTTNDGLALQRLDSCDKPRIAGPVVTDHTQQIGLFANTVAADPQGRWVAALDYQQLRFYGTSGEAAPVTLKLPIRPIALVAHPDGQILFALAIKETRTNGNEHFIFGRDGETVTAGALYAITIPEALRQLPVVSTKLDAVRCPPSLTARKQWSYRLPDSTPTLPVTGRLEPPDEMPSESFPFEEQALDYPPKDLDFADDGTLYVLYRVNTNGDSGIALWHPQSNFLLRSHFDRSVDPIFRLRQGWAAGASNGQLMDLLTRKLLLEPRDPSEGNVQLRFATDAETGEIYRIMDGRLERYGADAKPLPFDMPKGKRIFDVVAHNGNLASFYEDGTSVVWNRTTGKSWPFKLTSKKYDGCGIEEMPRLSADGQFLQMAYGCADSDNEYPIIDVHKSFSEVLPVTFGPVLGQFPKRSGRIVVPDARPNHLAVWNLSKGELLARLPRHPSRDEHGDYRGLRATISDDGRLVASASFDGLVRVWDIDAKRVVGEATVNGGVEAMVFDSTGRSLAVGVATGEVLILDTTGKSSVPKRDER